MRYCSRCVLPDTRPGLRIGPDGVCNACANHAARQAINWAARGRAFREVVRHARSLGRPYDCVIPVSGGKDSTWQVVTCLDPGLHPLAVTSKPPTIWRLRVNASRYRVRLLVAVATPTKR